MPVSVSLSLSHCLHRGLHRCLFMCVCVYTGTLAANVNTEVNGHDTQKAVTASYLLLTRMRYGPLALVTLWVVWWGI